MREIKFRAWDEDSKHMEYERAVLQYGLAYDKLMQFTGLLDKNGKEVFEGDIVRFAQNISSKPICKDVVAWNTHFAGFKLESRSQVIESTYNLEVIGNIYENKEVVK